MPKMRYVYSDVGPVKANLPIPTNFSYKVRKVVMQQSHMKPTGDDFRHALESCIYARDIAEMKEHIEQCNNQTFGTPRGGYRFG